jgi:hypothetical protein
MVGSIPASGTLWKVLMIISPSRDFIFIHLEKCGGTSVETALQPYLHWSDVMIGSTTYGERYQQNLYERFGTENVKKDMLWKHSTAKDIVSFVLPENWDDFTKISVVRDPLELVKSLYFFSSTVVMLHVGRINRQKWKEMLRTKKFPNAWPYNEGYIHAYAQSEIEGSGIDGFVKHCLSGGYLFISPQVHRIEAYPDSDLGVVVDLSSIDNRWQEVLDLIKIEEGVPLQKLNSSERDEDVELSEKSKKLIKKHFAIDYEVLPKYTGVSW